MTTLKELQDKSKEELMHRIIRLEAVLQTNSSKTQMRNQQLRAYQRMIQSTIKKFESMLQHKYSRRLGT